MALYGQVLSDILSLSDALHWIKIDSSQILELRITLSSTHLKIVTKITSNYLEKKRFSQNIHLMLQFPDSVVIRIEDRGQL